MPTYNYKSRELIAKIVYYGPGRCGKTTNLEQIHAKMLPDTRSELLSVATETDRTIYFDLLPLNLGTISGMKFMVRLFTVPGQTYYAETRKLVLKGVDGIVFVADSQDHMMDENLRSLRDLKDNLAANGIDYSTIPLVLQWNKRDLSPLIPEAELNATLNDRGVKSLPAVAAQGTGVLETLRQVTLSVFHHIKAGGKLQAPTSTTNLSAADAHAKGAPTGPISGAFGTTPASRAGSWSAALQRTGLGGGPLSGPSKPASTPMFGGAAARPPTSSRPAREDGPQPATIGRDVIIDEFKNLALMHGQLAERISELETEMARLGRENQEIRELLSRSLRL